MTKKMSRITSEILEMAEDMRKGGLMTEAEYEKITIRLQCVSIVNQKENTGKAPLRFGMRATDVP